jgi:hypothetical protein
MLLGLYRSVSFNAAELEGSQSVMCLIDWAPLVALEVLKVSAGRKLVVVSRHDDSIQFRLLFWRGEARAAHMSGVNWAACTRGRDNPLNRAARLRGHVTFCRHDDDGLVVTAEIRARCPRSPEAFRHATVSDGVRERGPREERRGENYDGAHGLLALDLNAFVSKREDFQPTA